MRGAATRIVRGFPFATNAREGETCECRIVRVPARGNGVIAEREESGHFSGTHRGRKHGRTPLRLQTVYVFELERQRVRRVREDFDGVGHERRLLAGGPQEENEKRRRSDQCRTVA